jgi:hypothetical protein
VTRPLWVGSLGLRAAGALAVVFVGYVTLHAQFAALDADAARIAVAALGFETSTSGAGTLEVHAGSGFDVFAIVTGACSSASGVLGIAAVALVLLPGRVWRRIVGGVLASVAFVCCNIARIVSILLLGWWLETADRAVLLVTLVAPAAACAALVVLPRVGVVTRVAALLAGGLFTVLAYDVWRGYDYASGMTSYHALAGPVLTFGTLALCIVGLWRVVVGPAETPPEPVRR